MCGATGSDTLSHTEDEGAALERDVSDIHSSRGVSKAGVAGV